MTSHIGIFHISPISLTLNEVNSIHQSFLVQWSKRGGVHGSAEHKIVFWVYIESWKKM